MAETLTDFFRDYNFVFKNFSKNFLTHLKGQPDATAQREELMEHLADYVYSLRSPRYLRIIFQIISNLVKERAFQESDLNLLCRRLVESQHLQVPYGLITLSFLLFRN